VPTEHDPSAAEALPIGAADDGELALLGVLATGLEFRQQQTNGLHIGEDAGRRAHEDLLALQRGAGDRQD
jgi:hypothetical protein